MTIYLMDAVPDEDSLVVVMEYVSNLLSDGAVSAQQPTRAQTGTACRAGIC